MADKQIIIFIKTLISKTKNKEIDWKYLDENKSLYENMNWVEWDYVLGSSAPNFNVEDSFYAYIDGTYVVLYVPNYSPATLYVIPSTFKKIRECEPVEYGSYITRLLNIVQSQFPSADQFIKNFSFDEITEV